MRKLVKNPIKQLDTLYLIFPGGYPISNSYSCMDLLEHINPYLISPFLILFSIGQQLMYTLIYAMYNYSTNCK